jgi:hypothetical protein
MLERKKITQRTQKQKNQINRRKKEDKEEKHTRPRKKDWKLMTEVPLKEKRKVSQYFRCESLEGKKILCSDLSLQEKNFTKITKEICPNCQKRRNI